MTPSNTLNFRLHALVYSMDQVAKATLSQISSVNLPQFLTVLCFYENPGQTQRFAAAWLQLTEATVSYNLKNLSLNGYLEIQNGKDARTKNVFLTLKGKKLVELTHPLIEKSLEAHLNVISKKELLEMQRNISLIHASIKSSFRETGSVMSDSRNT